MEFRFDKKVHFRHLLPFAFNRDGKNAIAAKAAHEICAVYVENAMPGRTAQWLKTWLEEFFESKPKEFYC